MLVNIFFLASPISSSFFSTFYALKSHNIFNAITAERSNANDIHAYVYCVTNVISLLRSNYVRVNSAGDAIYAFSV